MTRNARRIMKVIITYASAGAGHLKAAEAIYDFIKKYRAEVDVKIIDILEETNVFFRFGYSRGYSFLVNYVFLFWWLIFRLTYLKPCRKVLRPIAALINYLNTKKFRNFLIRENPDFIISTHFFPSEISASLKADKKIKSQVISVITDFGAHPFWISGGTSLYVVASDVTKKQLVGEGVPENIIRDLGIPVHSKFLEDLDKIAIREKIGIKASAFTVLIVTGSFGIGPIEKIVNVLYEDARLLVACGRNKKLYKRLKLKNYPNCFVFGFVDNMQEMMGASDVIITKPGGLTIAELLAMELPPIFISAIPGQETENARVLERHGVGFSVRKLEVLKNIILDLKKNPEKLSRVKDKIKEIKKPLSVKEICDVVC